MKISVWYGWTWAAATEPPGSTKVSKRVYAPFVSCEVSSQTEALAGDRVDDRVSCANHG